MMEQSVQLDNNHTFVTIKDTYPMNETLLSYENTSIAIKGELSAIVGKAKSRKSFFNTLLMKQLVKPDTNWKSNLTGRMLYVDTEQRAARVQSILHRLEHLEVSTEGHLFMAVRSMDTLCKMVKLKEVLCDYPEIEYVTIDNLRDFLPSGDINNQVDATNIVNEFVRLADFYNVHISLTLHTNPTPPAPGEPPKPSGAIGTKILQACSSIIYVDKTDLISSTVHPMAMRDGDFEAFSMRIDMVDKLAIPVYIGQNELTQQVAKDKRNKILARDHYLEKGKMAFTLKTILEEVNRDFTTADLAEEVFTTLSNQYENATPFAKDRIRKDIPKIFYKGWGLIKRESERAPWTFNYVLEDLEEATLPF